MTENEFYYRLTPESVMSAVEKKGYRLTGHCQTLNSLENRVFDLKTEAGRHIVVKFYRPCRWSREAILDEHDFLHELQSVEIPVCVPEAFNDGSTLGETDGIYFAVWNRTGGREPDEILGENLAIIGRLFGRLHQFGRTRPAIHRPVFTSDIFVREPLKYLNENELISSQWKKLYSETALKIAELFDEQSNELPILRIHGDAHTGGSGYIWGIKSSVYNISK